MRFPRTNLEQQFPVTETGRQFPRPNDELNPWNPGAAKRCVLGETCFPFGELSFEDQELVTQLETQQDAGGYGTVSAGSWPDIFTAARMMSFAPAKFYAETQWWIRFTQGAYVEARWVSVFVDVRAGVNKTAKTKQRVKVFADASFCTDASLISAVQYAVDGETAKTAIPTSYGSDLVTRVKNFELSWDSTGSRTVRLYVTDTNAQELESLLVVRVG